MSIKMYTGNLVDKAEVKQLESGSKLIKFKIAESTHVKLKATGTDGDAVYSTNFHTVTGIESAKTDWMTQKIMEANKGDRIEITAEEFTPLPYTNKDGKKIYPDKELRLERIEHITKKPSLKDDGFVPLTDEDEIPFELDESSDFELPDEFR